MLRTLRKKIPKRLIAFACVGAYGFLLDASILSVLIFKFGWNPYISRIISFGLALPFSWLLNRIWTFRGQASDNRTREYSIYAIIQSMGALLNLAIYSICIYSSAFMIAYPIVALAIGSGIALLFNFLMLKRYAFTGKTNSEALNTL
ncbi:MAG: GtrA family protein [bacterium]